MTRMLLVRVLCLAACVAFVSGGTTVGASPIRQLTQTSASNLRPVWSPDGKRIAFQTNRDGPYHIYVMDADGGNVRQLTSGDADDRHPTWSPDGKRIAVDSGSDIKRDIWVIDMASRARTQLTRSGAITSFPSWSPDGTRISYYVYRDGAMDIWTTDADGGNTVQLTRQLASERNNQCTFACHSPAWSPDGRQLAFPDADHPPRRLRRPAPRPHGVRRGLRGDRAHARRARAREPRAEDEALVRARLLAAAEEQLAPRLGTLLALLLRQPLRALRRIRRGVVDRRLGAGERSSPTGLDLAGDVGELVEDELELARV